MTQKKKCGRCGAECVVGRSESTVLSSELGANVALLSRIWAISRPGSSALLSMVPAELHCPCAKLEGLSVVDKVVVPERREDVKARFGTVVPMWLFLNLPAEWIAWDSLGLIRVDRSVDGLVLTDRPAKTILLDLMREMVAMGVSVPRIPEEVVLGKFQYLTMIRSECRAFAASLLGPEATLKQVFSRLNVDWYDWERLAHLQLDLDSTAFRLRDVRSWRLSVPHVSGECSVPSQFVLPLRPADDMLPLSNFSRLVLAEGVSYLPCGDVLVEHPSALVVFPAGIGVRLGDSYFDGGTLPVVVWVKGRAMLSVERPAPDHPLGSLPGGEYSVDVCVYDVDLNRKLQKWLRERFSLVTTSDTRFASRAHVAMMVTRKVPSGIPDSHLVYERNNRIDWEGVGWRRYVPGRGSGLISIPSGHLIDMTGDDVALRMDGTRVSGSVYCGRGVIFDHVQDIVDARLGTIVDSYAFSGGGPSPGEPAFLDFASGDFPSPSDMGVLLRMLRSDSSDWIQSWYKGLRYMSLIKPVQRVYAYLCLGDHPSLGAILNASSDFFDVYAVRRSALTNNEWRLNVVPAVEGGLSFMDAALIYVRAKTGGYMLEGSLLKALIKTRVEAEKYMVCISSTF